MSCMAVIVVNAEKIDGQIGGTDERTVAASMNIKRMRLGGGSEQLGARELGESEIYKYGV